MQQPNNITRQAVPPGIRYEYSYSVLIAAAVCEGRMVRWSSQKSRGVARIVSSYVLLLLYNIFGVTFYMDFGFQMDVMTSCS